MEKAFNCLSILEKGIHISSTINLGNGKNCFFNLHLSLVPNHLTTHQQNFSCLLGKSPQARPGWLSSGPGRGEQGSSWPYVWWFDRGSSLYPRRTNQGPVCPFYSILEGGPGNRSYRSHWDTTLGESLLFHQRT